MPTETFEVIAHSDADAKRVWDLVSDINSWRAWGRPMMLGVRRDRDGAPDPNGVGATRKVMWLREEIVEYVPPVRLSYVISKGLPVRRYRAVVELESAAAGGTTIRWRGQFQPIIRGSGPLLNRGLKAAIESTAKKLARGASR